MALSANTVWEIRQDGDDNNGGGYVSDAGTTDYSQQAAAQLTVTDGATAGATNTTLTSATGGFTSAMVGNVVHVWDAGGGSNITDGWYEIAAYTDTNTVTLDRAPDDGNGGVSGASVKVGGALASIGGMGAVFSTADQAVAGMKAYIKYSETEYSLTTDSVNTAGGPLDNDVNSMADKLFYMEGYETSRGDMGAKPIINAGTETSITIIKLEGEYAGKQMAVNIKVDGNENSSVTGFAGVGGDDDHYFVRCEAIDCTTAGFYQHGYVVSSKASNCGYGFQGILAIKCWADGCTTGFEGPSTVLNYCLATDCTGNGFGGGNNFQGVFHGCTAYNNGGHGFEDRTSSFQGTLYTDCVSVNNGGYGFKLSSTSAMFSCATYNNTSGRSDDSEIADIDPITMTGDPFDNQGSDKYEPDNTTNQGALLRGLAYGIPGQDDYTDVGAVQHEDAGGGGGGVLRRLAKQYGIG